jgi:plastocyanin
MEMRQLRYYVNLTRFVILNISVISILLFVQNMNLQVFAPLGSFMIYSDIYTGGGNTSMPLNIFDPVNKTIYAGESIKWTNPTAGKPYPHMVVFFGNASDNQQKQKILDLSKSLPASDPESVINNLNNLVETVSNIKENGSELIDARSILYPSLIESSSQPTVSYLDPQGNRLYKGATYNITGQEPYINSGLIWTGGKVPENFFKIYSFIMTFKKTGTYNYQCLLHPGMEGTVIVEPNPGKLGIQVK